MATGRTADRLARRAPSAVAAVATVYYPIRWWLFDVPIHPLVFVMWIVSAVWVGVLIEDRIVGCRHRPKPRRIKGAHDYSHSEWEALTRAEKERALEVEFGFDDPPPFDPDKADDLDLALWRHEHAQHPDSTDLGHPKGCEACGWHEVVTKHGVRMWVKRRAPQVLPALADMRGQCGICGGDLSRPARHQIDSGLIYEHQGMPEWVGLGRDGQDP